jgi:hypothetical protein
MDLFSDRGYQRHFDRKFLYHVALVLGIGGAFLAGRNPRGRPVQALAIGGVGALVVAYGFSHLSQLASVQPYRFTIPAMILFLAPAAYAVDFILSALQRAGRELRIAMLLLLLLIAPAFTAYLLDKTAQKPEVRLGAAKERILREIATQPVKGRILCDASDVADLIPWRCGRAVIGGLSTQAFLKHGFAGFDDDGRLFGRSASQWDAATLATYLSTYAVDYAIFSRREWLYLAAAHPELFSPSGGNEVYRIFAVRNAGPTLVLDGQASVAAACDRIEVQDVRSATLVLKLHYAGWLTASDGVRIEPVRVLDDPVPFIRAIVPPGVTRFTITKDKAFPWRSPSS